MTVNPRIQSDVIGRPLSSDDFVSSVSRSRTHFSRRSNFLTGVSSFPTGSLGNTRLRNGTAERYGSFALNIVDYAMEVDNAIYRQRGTRSLLLSPCISFPSTSTGDDGRGLLPHMRLFASPESTSFVSSLYTPYTQERPPDPTEFPLLNLVSPAPPPVDAGAGDMRNGHAAAHNWNSALLSNNTLTQMSKLPHSQIATAISPTPSLSHSEPSILSSPSPVSPVDCDVVKVAEVGEDDWLVSSSSTGSKRAIGGGRNATTVKKRSPSAKPTSVSRSGAARFPCNVPGCKQVCKTQGDLKRHQSVLSHKPPSWKCNRCNYRFTREDALKRHIRNLPKCATAKNSLRGRAASIKLQRSEVVSDVEAV